MIDAARSFAERRWLLILIVAAVVGVSMRTAWAVLRTLPLAGEAQNAARAFANGRGLADPYFPGSGPTAHLMPTTPLVAGGVYDLFGIGPTSEIILQSFAFLGIFGTSALLFATFRRLGLPLRFALGAFCFLALVPVFMGPESLDYRYWEGALATLLLAAILRWAVEPPGGSSLPLLVPGLGAAVACFVSPPVGVACLCVIAIKLLVDRAWRSGFAIALLFIAGSASLFTPWTLRNQHVLGETIVLRSNAGLELALANNPRLAGDTSQEAYVERLNQIHPSQSAAARQIYARVGEVAYFDSLKRETIDWIKANPGAFVRLSLRHVREMIWPQPWAFKIGSGVGSGVRSVIYGVIAIFGLVGAGMLAATVDRRFIYPLLAVGTIVLCYFPFQPVSRYIYLNYAVLVYCASSCLWLLLNRSSIARSPSIEG